MDAEHIWAVRDARNLNHKQKTFLFVLISRGEQGMFGAWRTNASDMGMSKDMYYRTRDSLIENGIVTAARRHDNTTVYSYDPEAHSQYEKKSSHAENDHSQGENRHSQDTECKENTKNNMKEELETEQDAPVLRTVTSSNDEIRREFNSLVAFTKWAHILNVEVEGTASVESLENADVGLCVEAPNEPQTREDRARRRQEAAREFADSFW